MTEAATRQRRNPGAPAWASLMVHGLEAGQEFYRELFGWEYRTGPQQLGPYVRAVADGHEVAGLGTKATDRQLPVAWLPYMASDDADETAGLIREHGGTVAVGPLDADSAGRMTIASDTLGAAFGVWQDATYPGLGIAPVGVRGAPVWFELITREASTAVKFYESVFGYETEAMGSAGMDHGMDYLTLYRDGVAVAGIHGVGQSLPRDRGPHWRTYFSVEDTDAAVRRVRELGGQVVREPQDSPYGRVAAVADPEGARFSVIRTEPSPR
ncbi:VOC family protein [Streptomyces sp. NPDC048172]|uniref:VOC family protein n=1 Tax=Streptomyces sp. NPDC048172 TaxID=3365505 RepID=UPI00371CB8E0